MHSVVQSHISESLKRIIEPNEHLRTPDRMIEPNEH